MNSKILTFIVSLFFVGSIFGQSNTISYTFLIEDCDSENNIELFSGQISEGEEIPFAEYTLPVGDSDAQFFYNLLVGGSLGFPANSLNENIHCDIMLAGICDLDITKITSEDDLLKLLYLVITVTGEVSGEYNSNEYYYLANGKESFLKIPLAQLQSFLNFVSYSIEDFTPFFITDNSEPDFDGIRKVVEEDFLTIYSSHFSTIGVGFKIDDPTNVNTVAVTPNEYGLDQNYPNPFNPTTTINYTLPNAGFTKLSVYNTIGEEVQSLVNENQSAGSYSLNFNASNLPSGLYFYTLTSGNFTQTNKMILMK